MLISCSLIDGRRNTLSLMIWYENAQISYLFSFIDIFIKSAVLGAGAKNVTSPFLMERSLGSALTHTDVKLPLWQALQEEAYGAMCCSGRLRKGC